MHYKNGRIAKNGDKVVLMPVHGAPLVGILYDATVGNDFSNARVVRSPPIPARSCTPRSPLRMPCSGGSVVRIVCSVVLLGTDMTLPWAPYNSGAWQPNWSGPQPRMIR